MTSQEQRLWNEIGESHQQMVYKKATGLRSQFRLALDPEEAARSHVIERATALVSAAYNPTTHAEYIDSVKASIEVICCH